MACFKWVLTTVLDCRAGNLVLYPVEDEHGFGHVVDKHYFNGTAQAGKQNLWLVFFTDMTNPSSRGHKTVAFTLGWV